MYICIELNPNLFLIVNNNPYPYINSSGIPIIELASSVETKWMYCPYFGNSGLLYVMSLSACISPNVIALLFYDSVIVILESSLIKKNDDQALNGIVIVLPDFEGCVYSDNPMLICLMSEFPPTAYTFVYRFKSVTSNPLICPTDVRVNIFSSASVE